MIKKIFALLFGILMPHLMFAMEMDPETRTFLDGINSANLPPVETWSLEQLRTDEQNFWGYKSDAPLKSVIDIKIPGPYGQIPVRIYQPCGNGPFPVMVTFHGGGWVTGSLKAHDGFCREVSSKAGLVVVSVDYRLAPENKFPIPVEECYAATKWAAENIGKYQGDPDRLAVSGDSSGGNLAAAVALMARDRNFPCISCQVLMYPALGLNFCTPSYCKFADGYFLTKNQMQFFWKHYLKDQKDCNPYAIPLCATDLKNLPATLIILAYFDPLRDDGVAYAKRLSEACGKVEVLKYPTIHGFISFADRLAVGKTATDAIINYLKANL